MPLQSINPPTARSSASTRRPPTPRWRRRSRPRPRRSRLAAHARFEERAVVLQAGRSAAARPRPALARLMALEMGKPVSQGAAEAEKCASVCDFYAEHAARLLAPEPAPTEARQSYVAFEPLGVVLAVMPWNFPLWQVFRFAAPALMAGNAALLKHASNVTGCALAIEEILHAAGVPPAAFRDARGAVRRASRPDRGAGGRGRDDHRQHAGGPRRRREGRRLPEEERARARRQRRLPRARGRRPRRRRPRSAPPRGSSTAARAASPPSASWWSSRCCGDFEERLVERMRARRSGRPARRRRRRSARWRAATCATSSSARSRRASRLGRARAPRLRGARRARAPSIRRASSAA